MCSSSLFLFFFKFGDDFISSSFLKGSFAGYIIPGIFFFLLALWLCPSAVFQTPFFQIRSQSLIAPSLLHVMSCFSLAAFQIFPFSLAFHSLTMIWLGVDSFLFIFQRIHFLGSVKVVFKFGKIWTIISSNFLVFFLCCFLSSFSFWNSHYRYVGIFAIVPQISKALLIFLQYLLCVLQTG